MPEYSHDSSRSTSQRSASTLAHSNAYNFEMPCFLRCSYLSFLSFVSLALCLIVCTLLWLSRKNHGLGADDGSNAVLLGWRFCPTLVAIIYSHLIGLMFYDVKRTEPFARMTRGEGASAEMSVLYRMKPWWSTFAEAFSRQKNYGKFSKVLICACTAYIVTFFLISPLSSVFLLSYNIAMPKDVKFNRVALPDTVVQLRSSPEALFRMKGHLSFNLSVSPWTHGKYTIFPFWPIDHMENNTLEAGTDSNSKSYTATTTVLSTEYACKSMDIKAKAENLTFLATASEITHHSGPPDVRFSDSFALWPITSTILVKSQMITLTLSDGECQIQASLSPILYALWDGSISWSYISGPNLPDSLYKLGPGYGIAVNVTEHIFYTAGDKPYLINFNQYPGPPEYRYNYSAGCHGKDIILDNPGVNRAWDNAVPAWAQIGEYVNVSRRAWSCTCNFGIADVPVSLSVLTNVSDASFDTDQFEKQRMPISDRILSTLQSQKEFHDASWTSFFDGLAQTPRGAGILLLDAYDLNLSALNKDKHLPRKAEQLFANFITESLSSSYIYQQDRNVTTIDGKAQNPAKRVVVIPSIAMMLAALFAFNTVLTISVYWLSRSVSRPLQSVHSPGTSLCTLMIMARNQLDSKLWSSLNHESSKEMKTVLSTKVYQLRPDRFLELDEQDSKEEALSYIKTTNSSAQPRWYPSIIRMPYLLALMVLLLSFLAAIVSLNLFARQNKLAQSALVYEIDLRRLALPPWKFTPFSVIPTMTSITIGLWWAALMQPLCSLQPFIAMTRSSGQRSRNGLTLHYSPVNWIETGVRASHEKHWIIALLSLGAILCQILTISSSALFERLSLDTSHTITVDNILENRQVPLDNDIDWQRAPLELFSAINQFSHEGSAPAWSHDGWSFVPVDLSSEDFGATDKISLRTGALRARAICSLRAGGYSDLNTSAWLVTSNLTDTTSWRRLNFSRDIDVGYSLSIYGQIVGPYYYGRHEFCPTNTSQNMGGGRWYPSSEVGWPDLHYEHGGSPSERNPCAINFTASWVFGRAQSGFIELQYGRDMPPPPPGRCYDGQFIEKPFFQMIECQPIIEESTAWITLDINKQVLASDIVDKVSQTDVPWKNIMNLSAEQDGMVWIQYPRESWAFSKFGIGYGIHFLRSVLLAPEIGDAQSYGGSYFIRDNYTHLEMDYLTYCVYLLAGRDHEALRNATTFMKLVDRVFGTVFQHYANGNVSFNATNWAFQRVGERQHDSIVPSNLNQSGLCMTSGGPFGSPELSTNRTVEVFVSREVEYLRMNEIATWLTITILTCLILILSAFIAIKQRYLAPIRRNIECLADQMVLLAGSERLLQCARQRGPEIVNEDIEIRLGWFKASAGDVRWGIELVEPNDRDGVEWVQEPDTVERIKAINVVNAVQSLDADEDSLNLVEDSNAGSARSLNDSQREEIARNAQSIWSEERSQDLVDDEAEEDMGAMEELERTEQALGIGYASSIATMNAVGTENLQSECAADGAKHTATQGT